MQEKIKLSVEADAKVLKTTGDLITLQLELDEKTADLTVSSFPSPASCTFYTVLRPQSERVRITTYTDQCL